MNGLVKRLVELREQKGDEMTLLAVCPNSEAVVEAAVKVAARRNTPMLFAATLNQVDRDGGYTGWTPAAFVDEIHHFAHEYSWDGPLYPCLDHGGPWLKDEDTTLGLTCAETMARVKNALSACIAAGYKLLHIDATVDRTRCPIAIDTVVARTIELMSHAEEERKSMGLPSVAYEVGTEEVQGGLVEPQSFRRFLDCLHTGLDEAHLLDAWPCFIVGKVGTDLHTTSFDPTIAAHLCTLVKPYGSLIKGHYTDWVKDLEAYPQSGMGGGNVGPEFTAVEFSALADLCGKEEDLSRRRNTEPSRFMTILEEAVIGSGRWLKWIQPHERHHNFNTLSQERKQWLVQTGARYVWTAPSVVEAREALYANLSCLIENPGQTVVDRIALSMERYITHFHLFDSLTALTSGASAAVSERQ